ncbi:GntR family transcriptional regulator [Nakamurella alba]|nr:GntR family transcriptional regulator [Nakamurella alba]
MPMPPLPIAPLPAPAGTRIAVHHLGDGGLDAPSAIPRHHALAGVLDAVIRSGGVRAGQQLPAEWQIADHFHLSVPTVRRALRTLADAGRISRLHGRGTFVA